ncbi:hypothetical protein C2E23DRAFT_87678 [Lenzites betulinus]|nr:hypothetical protein C2E23DRAFT_87678 [Lenzites betulinus]
MAPRKKKIRESPFERPARLPTRRLYMPKFGTRTSLQGEMGLEGDRAKFDRYVCVMRDCARQFFGDKFRHRRRRVEEQARETEGAFARKVFAWLPELKRYEDGWVPATYLRVWMTCQRRNSGRSCKTEQASSPPSRDAPLVETRTPAKDRAPREPTTQLATQRAPQGFRRKFVTIKVEDVVPTAPAAAPRSRTLPTVSPHRPRTQEPTHSSPSPPPTPRASTHAHSATPFAPAVSRSARKAPATPRTTTTNANPSSTRAPTPMASDARPCAVHFFLWSLTQPLGCLYPALHELGIRDHASLLGLVRRRGWYDWLLPRLKEHPQRRVTEVQWLHLVDGLRRLEREDAGEEP